MKNFIFILPFVLLACQTQQDPSSSASGQKEYALEKEEVIPLDRGDSISSESTSFSIDKKIQPQSQENIFEKIRFRKISVSRTLQNTSIQLESLILHPVEKNTESDAIKRANLQLTNLLQKWIDANYQKIIEKAALEKQSIQTWNEIHMNFLTENKVQIEMSAPFEGFKTLTEEIVL